MVFGSALKETLYWRGTRVGVSALGGTRVTVGGGTGVGGGVAVGRLMGVGN